MIKAYGGVTKFYNDFYINSPFPLAIVRKAKDGKWLNANYYDDEALFKSVKEYMIETLKKAYSLRSRHSEGICFRQKERYFLRKVE